MDTENPGNVSYLHFLNDFNSVFYKGSQKIRVLNMSCKQKIRKRQLVIHNTFFTKFLSL